MKTLAPEEIYNLILEIRELGNLVTKLRPETLGFQRAARKLARKWAILDFNLLGAKIYPRKSELPSKDMY